MAGKLGIKLIPLEVKLQILFLWMLSRSVAWLAQVCWLLVLLCWHLFILLFWLPLRWICSARIVRRPRMG